MKKIKRNIKYCLYKILNKHDFIQNINYNSDDQKKVLIVYVTSPFSKSLVDGLTHTNIQESLQIVKYFINNNYCIDVIDCMEKEYKKLIKKNYYNCVIGLGDAFKYACEVNRNCKHIMYLTESSPRFSYKQEVERVKYYNQRYRKRIKITRSNMFYKDSHFKDINNLILIGNEHTKSTYDYLGKNIFTIDATGLKNKSFKNERNINESKLNFLWFGSYGAIHKGLDILVDIFNNNPDINLFIAGLRKEEEKYIKLGAKNIHNIGFVNVNSEKFNELMNKCSFVILPSCSEGMATSVLTCMNHGLIPLITKECGISLEEQFLLQDYSSNKIEEKIKLWTKKSNEEIFNLHKYIELCSLNKYGTERFYKNFSKIMNQIIGDKNEDFTHIH